jgi:hypothetical protein
VHGSIRLLWGLAVVVAVALTLAHDVRAKPRWSPDSFLYTRMMLVDTGLSEDAAHALASRYYMATPAGVEPTAPGFYGPNPPQFYVAQYALFRARTLYPWLGSLLYSRLGFRALDWISALGVALAAGAIYALLLFVAPSWLAACGALAAVSTAQIRNVGTLATTDGPALAEWTLALVAMLAYARRPSRGWLLLAVVASALLAITRPAIWLPVGAAAGMAVAAYRAKDVGFRRAALVMLVAQLAVAAGALAYTAALHGAGLFEQLQWQYDWHRYRHGHWVGYGIVGWYLLFVLRDVVIEPIWLVAAGTPVLAIAAGAVGLWRHRGDPVVPVLVGVACVAPLAIFTNPEGFDRPFELSLTPVVMIGLCALLADGLRRRASAPASSEATRST